MGILNVTPDSFYDGGVTLNADDALRQVEKMLGEGASFIDVGGYSTRPGASDVSVDEERRRTVPVIARIAAAFPEALISVDTFRAAVARECIEAGAVMVNDVSAGTDDADMLPVVASFGNVPYILMHKKGSPQTMQQHPHYDNVVAEVMDFLVERAAAATAAGITDLVIDPGFGFGKTLQHNYALLKALGDFCIFGLPVLAGLSRKNMIRKVTGSGVEDALNGTTVVNTIALLNGANILRVHDVKEASECLKIVNATYGDLPVI